MKTHEQKAQECAEEVAEHCRIFDLNETELAILTTAILKHFPEPVEKVCGIDSAGNALCCGLYAARASNFCPHCGGKMCHGIFGDETFVVNQDPVEALANLKKCQARYEFVRTLKLREFADIWERNMAGENFDDQIDQAIAAKKEI